MLLGFMPELLRYLISRFGVLLLIPVMLVALIVFLVLIFPKLAKIIYNAMRVNSGGEKKIPAPTKMEPAVATVKPPVKAVTQTVLKSSLPLKLVLISVALAIVFFVGFGAWQKFGGRVKRAIGCEPLTPKVLEELENAGGFRPNMGEICNLSEKNYFLRILYGDSQAAYGAALTLASGSKGKHRKLEGVNLVQDDKTSAFFFSDGDKLGVLVFNEKKSDSDLVASLKKLIEGEWPKETGNLQVLFGRTVENDVAGQMLEQAAGQKAEPTPESRPEATPTPAATTDKGDEEETILSTAKKYVYDNLQVDLPEYSFKVTLTKRVGNYALVAVNPDPPGSFEPAGVVLEKISGQWVGQEMATVFPEWEEKVPELFNFN